MGKGREPGELGPRGEPLHLRRLSAEVVSTGTTEEPHVASMTVSPSSTSPHDSRPACWTPDMVANSPQELVGTPFLQSLGGRIRKQVLGG